MSKKTPDTRNKLDNNKGSKPRKKPKLEKKKLSDLGRTSKVKVEKKVSKGQLFKAQHGYSKTMKRNMHKHGVTTVEEYKVVRKKRKQAERKIQQDKHSKSTAYKRANGKKKGAKGKTPQPKQKK